MKFGYLLLIAFFLSACGPVAPTLTAPPSTPAAPTSLPFPTSTTVLTITTTPDKPIGTKKNSPLDSMVQVYVPAGAFQMGTSTASDWTGEDEFPLHQVFLPSYWI